LLAKGEKVPEDIQRKAVGTPIDIKAAPPAIKGQTATLPRAQQTPARTQQASPASVDNLMAAAEAALSKPLPAAPSAPSAPSTVAKGVTQPVRKQTAMMPKPAALGSGNTPEDKLAQTIDKARAIGDMRSAEIAGGPHGSEVGEQGLLRVLVGVMGVVLFLSAAGVYTWFHLFTGKL